jgi:hypothetical protein
MYCWLLEILWMQNPLSRYKSAGELRPCSVSLSRYSCLTSFESLYEKSKRGEAQLTTMHMHVLRFWWSLGVRLAACTWTLAKLCWRTMWFRCDHHHYPAVYVKIEIPWARSQSGIQGRSACKTCVLLASFWLMQDRGKKSNTYFLKH